MSSIRNVVWVQDAHGHNLPIICSTGFRSGASPGSTDTSGDGINGILGALDRARERMHLVQVRHEEMAAFMACAHAKSAASGLLKRRH